MPKRDAANVEPEPARDVDALRWARRLAALHRGDFGLRDRGFRDSDGRLFTGPITRVSPRSSCPVQPIEGRPLLVGADGDPAPPEPVLARHSRGRRRPRSACPERLRRRPR